MANIHKTLKQIGADVQISIDNGSITSNTGNITLAPNGDLVLTPGGQIKFTATGDGYLLAVDGDLELAVSGPHQIKAHNKFTVVGATKDVSIQNGIIDIGTGDLKLGSYNLKNDVLLDMALENWTILDYEQDTIDLESIDYSPANEWYTTCGGTDFWAASIDGTVWLADTSPPDHGISFTATAVDNATPPRVFVTGYGNGHSMLGFISDNYGQNWTQISLPVTDPSLRPCMVTHNHIAPGAGGRWISTGYGGYMIGSSDGYTWTDTTHALSSTTMWFVRHSRDVSAPLWIAGGSSGKLETSTNGTSWTERTTGKSDTLYDAAWNGTAWVVVGSNGCIIRSTNGIDWTDVSIADIKYPAGNNGSFTWVCVGPQNTFIVASHVSKDNGLTWTRIPMGAVGVNDVVYAQNRFVAVCDDCKFAHSLKIKGL